MKSAILVLFVAFGVALADDKFQPCNRYITVMFDASNSISTSQYTALQGVLNNQVFGGFNHFERVALGSYARYVNGAEYGVFQTLDEVQQFVKTTNQIAAKPIIRRALAFLSSNQMVSGRNETMVVFVGQLTDEDVDDSKEYANQIKQFARLSLIGVNKSVNKDNLGKLADYSYVFDLDRGVPTDFTNIMNNAYGCN